MITCQKCGHENQLGTLFCHSCGTQLKVTADMVMGSVANKQATDQQEKRFQAGIHAVTIGGFVFIAVLILRSALVPNQPDPGLPVRMIDVSKTGINPASAAWQAGQQSGTQSQTAETAVTFPEPQASNKQQSLLAWRAQHAELLLSPVGVDMSRLRLWQRAIVERQLPNGTFPGGDTIAATAMACLGLQCYPGDVAIDAAAEKARVYLRKQVSSLVQGQGSDLARTLTGQVLYASETEFDNQLSLLIRLLGSGKQADWQCLSLLCTAKAKRPKALHALRSPLGKEPYLQALLQILDPSFTFDTAGLARDADAANSLDGFQRLAWSWWQWLSLDNMPVWSERVHAWSRVEEPVPAPPALSAITGAHTDFALALLTCTVTLQAPVDWHRSR